MSDFSRDDYPDQPSARNIRPQAAPKSRDGELVTSEDGDDSDEQLDTTDTNEDPLTPDEMAAITKFTSCADRQTF
jgi:hypothetical protein